jgi:CheY-like chemotaxis protein/ketosteroid isomerase-like protein
VNRNVLVVDDDEKFGESLAEMLRFLDFHPTVCTTAQQALYLTKNCKFDLFFSDIRMPGINGFEFCRFLAAVDESLPKRVIFVTGDARTKQLTDKQQVVCIEKPVKFDDLERTIAQVLARIDRPETSSSPTQPLSNASGREPTPKASFEPEAAVAEQELIDLENAWNEALVNGNNQAFNVLLADTCIHTLPSGSTLTKAEMQSALTSGEGAVASAKTDDIKIRVCGNTAIVNARCTVKETVRGKAVSRPYRFTHTWVREGRTWRCIASHDSKIKQIRA